MTAVTVFHPTCVLLSLKLPTPAPSVPQGTGEPSAEAALLHCAQIASTRRVSPQRTGVHSFVQPAAHSRHPFNAAAAPRIDPAPAGSARSSPAATRTSRTGRPAGAPSTPRSRCYWCDSRAPIARTLSPQQRRGGASALLRPPPDADAFHARIHARAGARPPRARGEGMRVSAPGIALHGACSPPSRPQHPPLPPSLRTAHVTQKERVRTASSLPARSSAPPPRTPRWQTSSGQRRTSRESSSPDSSPSTAAPTTSRPRLPAPARARPLAARPSRVALEAAPGRCFACQAH